MFIRKIYHTQEHRENLLTKPKKCLREDAWLGDAYYFWYSEFDADKWGETSKGLATNKVVILTASFSNILHSKIAL